MIFILIPMGARPLLSYLKFCLALERYQAMTAAARALGTNTATVSRRIDRLTEAAGEPIFLRDNTQ
ncbi:MAG: LysR family transcriptional regulator [Rhodobacteraceae bacterium]|nr:LysR family transcriptional regulator [Paracoccaceae bacterium]